MRTAMTRINPSVPARPPARRGGRAERRLPRLPGEPGGLRPRAGRSCRTPGRQTGSWRPKAQGAPEEPRNGCACPQQLARTRQMRRWSERRSNRIVCMLGWITPGGGFGASLELGAWGFAAESRMGRKREKLMLSRGKAYIEIDGDGRGRWKVTDYAQWDTNSGPMDYRVALGAELGGGIVG